MSIYKPSQLHQLGLKPKKKFSQNFLVDRNILEKICLAANVKSGDRIVEIGPGPGALTEILLSKGAHVTAIEKDPDMILALQRLSSPSLQMHCMDALHFPYEDLETGTKVVANLPYHITTPIIGRLLPLSFHLSSLTVMVQKEMGIRMGAKVDTPDYSNFSLFLQSYSDVRYCFTVKRTCFFPAPGVDSCMMHLQLTPFKHRVCQAQFFQMTRKAFNQKRKMLRTSLKEEYGAAHIEEALIAIGKSPTARPQELSPSAFAQFFKKLQKEESED